LPLLGHGARSDGAGKHARESEDSERSTDDTGGEEEDVAALIRRGRSAGAVGTKGDVVCCRFRVVSKMPLSMEYRRFVMAAHSTHWCCGTTRVPPPENTNTSYECAQHESVPKKTVHTSFLLLHSHLLPVHLHAVPKRHPQVGLLLGRHVFPSLLDVGEGRVGNGVRLAGLLKLASYGGSSGKSCACRDRWHDGSRAPGSPGEGGAQHGGGWSGDCRKMEKKGRRFPSRDLRLPMGWWW
jgi:hypothetical protein